MDTITTSLPEKLPESVRGLVDENVPLPPGVIFFEQRYTSAMLVKRILIAGVLFFLAVVLVLWSLEFLYYRHIDPKYQEYVNFKALMAGLAFGYGGWLMLSSIGAGRQLIRRQAAGGRTRHGIFLTPAAFVCQSQFDTTVIPPECFRGVHGGSVKYLLKNVPNSFVLPAEWVGASPAEVGQAIEAWNLTVSSQVPPTPPAMPPSTPQGS